MNKIGIESISFYSSNYFLDLSTLSKIRGIPVEKYNIGLGQYRIAVSPPGEDIVTLGANAASNVVTEENINDIGMVIFATESSIDQSKAAALYIHRLLGLHNTCRVIELKQACYSATAALLFATTWIYAHPNKKVLIIAADISRYGLGSLGEPTQGAGAVAIIMSNQPRIVTVETESGVYTEEAMDFWRPNYKDEAIVDGKYSCDLYLKALERSWNNYKSQTNRSVAEHAGFLFHTPTPKLTHKALKLIAEVENIAPSKQEELTMLLNDAQKYSKIIGNCYTASLYLTLISLLDARDDLEQKRLGLYSYGSGCIGEFFSVQVCSNYSKFLHSGLHQCFLDERQELSYALYEEFYNAYPKGEACLKFSPYNTGAFRLTAIDNHVRLYKKTS